MKKREIRRILGVILSLAIVASYAPIAGDASYASEDKTLNNSEAIEPSAENEDIEETTPATEQAEESIASGENENSEDLIQESENDTDVAMLQEIEIILDEEIKNGEIEASKEDSIITGTATPDAGYDLASIRLIMEDNSEKYIDYEYNEEGDASKGYSFSFNISDIETSNYKLTATFISTKIWDGAVDISWYNPNKSSFDISTPAQLAGVAAIVNGMIDPNETSVDQIKALKHDDIEKYIKSEPCKVQLLEQQGGGIDDIAYRKPKARNTGIFGDDDLYNDMRYRTINITADINMGTEKNFTPIGGKYAMIVKNDSNLKSDEVKVIDARFHGIFDGHGHTITVNCNRYSSKGYGYTWNVGLIGYLGGGIDTDLNSAKDNKIENYSNTGYAPAVRNVVLKGSIKGRRGTGGIVGRIGQTNGTVIVENCANYATVRGTDKVGCGGVVGAPWGRSVIRNCYNAGTVRCSQEEVGGIAGCNGYGWNKLVDGKLNNIGANIYNCFNVGEIQHASVASGEGTADQDKDISYVGGEISYDGDASAEYIIDNCFYIEHEDSSVPAANVKNNSNAFVGNVQAVSSEEMKGDYVLEQLNANGNVFVKGSEHPLLYFEKGGASSNCNVSISKPKNGAVSANGNESSIAVPYGTVINLQSSADDGYRLSHFLVDGKAINNDFYTVTGDVSISGNFIERGKAVLTIAKSTDYKISVTCVDSKIDSQKGKTLVDGDVIYEGDVLELSGKLLDNAKPVNPDYEYTGRFGKASAVDPASVKADSTNTKRLIVTGESDVIVRLEPKLQLKDWATYADTDWYYGHEEESTYTISTANQLAGMAKILCDGKNDGGSDFENKTIKLGCDIDLQNPDVEGGKRLWRTVGNNNDTFKGTFDGCGYTIKNIYVSHVVPVVGIITGNHGGLFGFTDGATIKNLTIEGRFWATAGDTGVFVGKAKNTTIHNCESKVVLDKCKETGAIVGDACGTTRISNCKNTSDIDGMRYLAGIVSKVSKLDYIGAVNDVVIENCYNYGKITGTFCNNAGLCALVETKATIRNCANYGDITTKMTSEPSDLLCAVGGLVAVDSGALTMESCMNSGTVSADGYTIYCGGLVGYITVSTPKIYNSYNSGAISSNSRYSKPYVSGLFNAVANRYPEVKNCYNRGKVSCGPLFTGNGYAGIAAIGTGTKIVNTYCTEESVSEIEKKVGIESAGINLLSEETLKTKVVDLGVGFNKDMDDINGGCPILLWQDPEDKGHVHIWNLTKTVNPGNCKNGYKLYTCRCKEEKTVILTGYSTSYVKSFKLVAGKKKITAKWKKQSSSTQKKFVGYQIQYSLKSNFSGAKLSSLKKSSSSKKLSGLKAKKKYYVRIRTYTKKNGKTFYSKWTTKSIKTK